MHGDDDHVDVRADYVAGGALHVRALLRCAADDQDIRLAFHEAMHTQAFAKGVRHGRRSIDAATRGHSRDEETDPPDLPRLLPLGGERRAMMLHEREPLKRI